MLPSRIPLIATAVCATLLVVAPVAFSTSLVQALPTDRTSDDGQQVVVVSSISGVDGQSHDVGVSTTGTVTIDVT
ncbi:hypothetical protein B7R21_03325 [Subtercola boreus]|uniref:Uncharacterized protein n=1 Tax=Subtercola boreus TaxID=120213 RepID=A0A3E0W1T9_9MICO|nr:hypothetical protein [Subtercola boreus]RFA15749.1 hypothetical protein B7R21_03325 [Subtercola boreus]